MQLRRDELDEHLAAAASIGRQLGMTADDIASRLREAFRARDENER
jgi:hypothetical protein